MINAKVALSLQNAYAEMIQQLHSSTEPTGSIYGRLIAGKSYVYVKRSFAGSRTDEFLGRSEDPKVKHKVEAIRAANARANERRALVGAMKHYGYSAPSRKLGMVLEALSEAGLLRTCILVGTSAYQCYGPLLGVDLKYQNLMTMDADLATAELAITADCHDRTMEEILRKADATFASVPGLTRGAFPSQFRSADGFMVDLLTPTYRSTDTNPMPLPNLQAGATPLQHLAWLIEEPMNAAVLYKSGIAVRVPQPARYAIHKLIVAQKRKADAVKRNKDLQQAEELIRVLKSIASWQLSDAYEDANAQGEQGWKKHIHRSLKELGMAPKDLRAE